MARERDARSRLGLALEVHGGRVEIIDAIRDGVVHQFVDGILVHDLLSVGSRYHLPAHAAVAEKGDLVAGVGVGTERHPFGHLDSLAPFLRAGLAGGRGAQRNGAGARLDEISSGYVFHSPIL